MVSGSAQTSCFFICDPNEFLGRRIARADWGSSAFTVYYYFVDHLGSTRSMTSAAGSACFKADYLPYGAENTPSGFTDTCNGTYKFTGYERDGETGLDYAFARYYNQRLGRFMSGDPLGGDTGDPQSLNRYAYVRNNPINAIDPTGMDCVWVVDRFVCGGGGGGLPSPYPEPGTAGNPNDTCRLGGTWPNCNEDPNHNPEGDGGLAEQNACIHYHQSCPVQPTVQAPRPKEQTPQTPWYSTCTAKAIGNGLLHVGIDSIGLIPEGGLVSRAVGDYAFGYRGIVATQQGTKAIQAVQMGTAIGSTGVGANNTSTTGSISTGLGVAGIVSTLAGAAPVFGQVLSGLTIAVDLGRTGMEIAKCN